MEDLKTKYNQVVLEREKLIEQIKILRENESVKRYFELRGQNIELANLQEKLYRQIKFEEYSSCNHIWVNTLHEYDSWEGNSHNYCGCIKCGLDERILKSHKSDLITLDQKIMYDFMREENNQNKDIYTNILCDLNLAKAIYSKIKEVHPNIDDEAATKYFEVALHHIRDTKVNDERKVSRAKRLSLSPKFNKWTGNDVDVYI